jgi:hypothetical protein
MTLAFKSPAARNWLIGAGILALVFIVAAERGLRRNIPDSKPQRAAVPDFRPSPIAETIQTTERHRIATKAEEPLPPPPHLPEAQARYNSTDKATDWAVIAATYYSWESAQRRADSLKSHWPDCECTVYPPQGEGTRYYVLVGEGLKRNDADRLRDRGTAAGLPPDTYVSKLIQRTEQP